MPDFRLVFRGYHRDQVDAFIARIEGTLGRAPLYAQPVTPEAVSAASFRFVLRGYRVKEVDEALDRYVRELERHSGGRHRIRGGDVDRLVGLVRNVRFATTRLTEGYDERQVDVFLDELIVGLRAHRVLASHVRAARFATTRIRPGYSQPDVDGFLDRVASELERLRQR